MNLRWLTKLLKKLFQWLRGRRPQAVAAETPVPQIAPRRRLPKTGGAFGHPRWMRAEGVKPL
jgi:hypothetical protein